MRKWKNLLKPQVFCIVKQYKKKNLLILKILFFLYLKTIFEIAENVHEKGSGLNVTKKEKKESNSLEKKE